MSHKVKAGEIIKIKLNYKDNSKLDYNKNHGAKQNKKVRRFNKNGVKNK